MSTPDDLDALARVYSEPADIAIENRVEAWVAPKIAAWCGKGRVIDLGWGSGTMGRALLAAGVDLTVIEGSTELGRDALRVGASVVHSMFEDYEPREPFDVCLALFVLEHLERPVDVLRRARGWLRPGGKLVAAVPNANSFHRYVGRLMTGLPLDTLSDRDKMVGHLRVYDLDELRGNVIEAGFQVVDHAGWYHKVVPNSLSLGWAPELIDALCEVGWRGDPDDAANILVRATAP